MRQWELSRTRRICSFATSAMLTLRCPAGLDGAGQSDGQFSACRHDHRPLHDIPQLADVAGPGVLLQRGHVVPGDRVNPLAKRLPEFGDEAPHEERYIFGALAQRRHLDGEDVEPIEQVLAKCFLGDPLLEIPVRGRDDPHVHANGFRAAKPFDLPLLQHAQQLDLDVCRQVADLVEEDCRVIGQFETSDLLARARL